MFHIISNSSKFNPFKAIYLSHFKYSPLITSPYLAGVTFKHKYYESEMVWYLHKTQLREKSF